MRISRTGVLLSITAMLMLGDFILRGVVPALTTGKNDFSDPYIGAWLWTHGKNPYDRALATSVSAKFTHSQIPVVPIYPPTTFVLLSPLSRLPWGWANLVWSLFGIAGVATIAFGLIHIGGLEAGDGRKWLVLVFTLTFAPFHTSVHVGNAAVVSIALCVVAVYLGTRGQDLACGITLAMASALKPQLGIWLALFYLARRRWLAVAAAALTAIGLAAIAFVRIPLSPTAVLHNYSANLQYWFGPGGQNDFSSVNPLRFQLVNLQVVLYPLTHDAVAANLWAYAIFAIGIGLWAYAVFRHRMCPDTLALSSLLALSFLPVYHRVYDLGILTLVLCWLLGGPGKPPKTVARVTLLLLLLFLLPGQAMLARSQPYLPVWVAGSWWWNLILAPHAVWAILMLNAVLLYALWTTTPQVRRHGIDTLRAS